YLHRNTFTEGARIAGLDRSGVSATPARGFDAYSDGARAGKFDPYTDGALVAGLDRTGVSATPARSFDAYTDGARSGKVDVFTEGANA
ncbi:copper resistance protein CopQ, partial [Cupriavidus sp. YAF13]